MDCPVCGKAMEEYSVDHWGIDSGLSPTVYTQSYFICETPGCPGEEA